jgi:hypothetical protein
MPPQWLGRGYCALGMCRVGLAGRGPSGDRGRLNRGGVSTRGTRDVGGNGGTNTSTSKNVWRWGCRPLGGRARRRSKAAGRSKQKHTRVAEWRKGCCCRCRCGSEDRRAKKADAGRATRRARSRRRRRRRRRRHHRPAGTVRGTGRARCARGRRRPATWEAAVGAVEGALASGGVPLGRHAAMAPQARPTVRRTGRTARHERRRLLLLAPVRAPRPRRPPPPCTRACVPARLPPWNDGWPYPPPPP